MVLKDSMSKSDVFSKTIEFDQSACYSTKVHLELLSLALSLTNVVERICLFLADIRIDYFAHIDVFKMMKLISHTNS
jgi:hypothetical protein